MKKHVLLAGVLLLSAISFGQKKEIKKAEKALKNGSAVEALTILNSAEGLLTSGSGDLRGTFYLVKGKALTRSAGMDTSKLMLASEAFSQATSFDSEGSNANGIAAGELELRDKFEDMAGADYEAKRYKEASSKYYAAYGLNKSDTLFLYNAALVAKMGKDYESAGTYFNSLIDLGYTGITKQFTATNKETGESEPFGSKGQRDLMVKAGTHINPTIETSESKRESILLGLAQIYIDNGDSEKAVALIEEVRKTNPDDSNLIQVEADIAYGQGDIAHYNKLMQEMIALEPNNPALYNNFGVASAKLGLKEEAIGYYKKALELDPNNPGAQVNIAVLILEGEGALNEKMNALGTSNADYAKYDEYKAQKSDLYREAMPYLESALESGSDNIEVVRTLMGIYSQLGEDAKFKASKARLQEMEGGQ